MFKDWLYPRPEGLFCEPGNFWIDPHAPVERAIVSHGHSDHAYAGHHALLASHETIAIMRQRLGPNFAQSFEAYTAPVTHNGVTITLYPAGHILGSTQVCMEWQGQTAIFSGDYKRAADPTCAPFETVRCDLFITEATFALPVFRHEPAERETARLLHSLAANPDRAHLLGAYSLGKSQRLIRILRDQGYDAPIFLHGALIGLCTLYNDLGIALGDLRPVAGLPREALKGQLVLCPPSALNDRWSRRLPDPITCFASGWMRVRGRARQRGVEFPMVVSDHCDWPELLQTISDVDASEIWVTHGREDALMHEVTKMGKKAQALALVGFEDEGD